MGWETTLGLEIAQGTGTLRNRNSVVLMICHADVLYGIIDPAQQELSCSDGSPCPSEFYLDKSCTIPILNHTVCRIMTTHNQGGISSRSLPEICYVCLEMYATESRTYLMLVV